MGSHWTLTDNKSPQVSWILLSILAYLNNAVVWKVSTRPLISKSSSPFMKPLVSVPRAPTTINIATNFRFHIFFNSLARSRYLFFAFFFQLYSMVSGHTKVHNSTNSLCFLLIMIRSGLLAEIRWSACMSKSHRSLCHFLGPVVGCAYTICSYG